MICASSLEILPTTQQYLLFDSPHQNSQSSKSIISLLFLKFQTFFLQSCAKIGENSINFVLTFNLLIGQGFFVEALNLVYLTYHLKNEIIQSNNFSDELSAQTQEIMNTDLSSLTHKLILCMTMSHVHSNIEQHSVFVYSNSTKDDQKLKTILYSDYISRIQLSDPLFIPPIWNSSFQSDYSLKELIRHGQISYAAEKAIEILQSSSLQLETQESVFSCCDILLRCLQEASMNDIDKKYEKIRRRLNIALYEKLNVV